MEERRGEIIHVVHVRKADASRVKSWLERQALLHRDFRATPSLNREGCLAIPIQINCQNSSLAVSPDTLRCESDTIVDVGAQFCPYSSSRINRQQSSMGGGPFSLVQQALLQAFQDHIAVDDCAQSDIMTRQSIYKLSSSTCPRSLELLGDDRTIVLPETALCSNDPFLASIMSSLGLSSSERSLLWQEVWKHLARLYRSRRVVRRAPVDPGSPIRQSHYCVLWPSPSTDDYMTGSQPSGPGSPGWITVTEQGIRQSFDLTRVMFSRGNITEKIRVAGLVRPGERVLDMYGGIGYFTLPALVHGRAAHVTVCEWNPDAVHALEFNLRDNQVEDRATVLKGDCRRLAVGYHLVRQFDRVFLGLLPSSEGGWATAVKSLRQDAGGWLHVHGNVPVPEAFTWLEWLCVRLKGYLGKDENELHHDWVVLGHHLEKVKSFAPTVNHYVADVYLGPRPSFTYSTSNGPFHCEPGFVGFVEKGKLKECRPGVKPPSCALSATGALHQEWMR